MPYYRICPDCGAHLDPDEPCDCHEEKAALRATNTQDGKVAKEYHPLGYLHIITKMEVLQ